MAVDNTKVEMRLEARVYLMVRRGKDTLFVETKNTSTLSEVKAVVQKITGVDPAHQRLYLKDQVMEDDKTLKDYMHVLEKEDLPLAHNPVTVGLALMTEDGHWEDVKIEPVSKPIPLPEAMQVVLDGKLPTPYMHSDKTPSADIQLDEKIPIVDNPLGEKIPIVDTPLGEKIPIVDTTLGEKIPIVDKPVSSRAGDHEQLATSATTTV